MGMGGVITGILVLAVLWLWWRKPRDSSSRDAPVTLGKPSRKALSASVSVSVAPAPVSPETTPSFEPLDVPRALPEALATFNLIQADALDEDAWKRVQGICDAMAEPHPVQLQLAGGLDSPEELRDVVSSDAGITASVLRTVNSAAFALATPINSVQHAITYLGVNLVKGLVAKAALAERVSTGTPEQQAALEKIWQSAGVASAFSQLLGQELGVERPSVLATRSLFFNFGDVAMVLSVDGADGWYQEGVTITERIDAQQQACGANTAIVGAALARHWHLPDELTLAIEEGFLPLVTPPSDYPPLDADEYRHNVLMYLAGRIGDRATYRGLRDVADLELTASEEPALFYLPEHLRAARLARIPALLQEAGFRRKANRLLATLAA